MSYALGHLSTCYYCPKNLGWSL